MQRGPARHASSLAPIAPFAQGCRSNRGRIERSATWAPSSRGALPSCNGTVDDDSAWQRFHDSRHAGVQMSCRGQRRENHGFGAARAVEGGARSIPEGCEHARPFCNALGEEQPQLIDNHQSAIHSPHASRSASAERSFDRARLRSGFEQRSVAVSRWVSATTLPQAKSDI